MSTSTVDTTPTSTDTEDERRHASSVKALARNTLVLSADFRPVLVVPRERAFTLLFSDKARVVAHYDDVFISSAHARHLVPAVIVLATPVKYRKTRIKFTRRALYRRDNYKCQYCGDAFTAAELTFDHVIPVSRGGKTTWDNIVACCVRCNRKKANKTPAEAGMVVLNWPTPPDSLTFAEIHDISHVPEVWRPYLGSPKRKAGNRGSATVPATTQTSTPAAV